MKKNLVLLLVMMCICTSCNLHRHDDVQVDVTISISNAINLEDDTADEARISFNDFPTNLTDWEQMRTQVKNAPEGVLLMQLLAFELYHKRTFEGQQAVAKNSTTTAYNETMERLPDIFGKQTGGDIQYARPYIVWSYLEGATPENGYKPSTPYTIRVRERMNSKQWSDMGNGYVYTLEVYSEGYDTHWRAVQVIFSKGEWLIFSCPALYAQCKEIQK